MVLLILRSELILLDFLEHLLRLNILIPQTLHGTFALSQKLFLDMKSSMLNSTVDSPIDEIGVDDDCDDDCDDTVNFL